MVAVRSTSMKGPTWPVMVATAADLRASGTPAGDRVPVPARLPARKALARVKRDLRLP